MSREFVHLEIREAIRHKKRIILLHESDERFDKVDFRKEQDQAPIDLKSLFKDIESIPWRRKKYERRGMLEELMLRAGRSYKEHFQKQSDQQDVLREKRLSVITKKAVWFNHVRQRVALSVHPF